MLTPRMVKASVVDITRPIALYPKRITIDAQVLYFIHYPNFAHLEQIGVQIPTAFKTAAYGKFIKQAVAAQTNLTTACITFTELIRTIEHAELELLFLTDPNASGDFRRKEARYRYAANLQVTRGKVLTIVNVVRKTVDVLPMHKFGSQEFTDAAQKWEPSLTDFPDATLVATASQQAIYDILSDDQDLVSIEGITVYTANKTAVNAAHAANKLRNPQSPNR
jgi:hypothetical protein